MEILVAAMKFGSRVGVAVHSKILILAYLPTRCMHSSRTKYECSRIRLGRMAERLERIPYSAASFKFKWGRSENLSLYFKSQALGQGRQDWWVVMIDEKT